MTFTDSEPAQAPPRHGTEPEQTVFLSFHIAGEEYAIPVARVSKVIEFDCLTKVPNMPACIRGLMNLRGAVVPCVDLGVKFGSTAMELTKWTCVVVVEVQLDGEATVMGIMADALGEVIETSPGEIDPPPAFGTRIRVDYLSGMVKVGRKFVLILDIDRVLSVDELLSVELMLTDSRTNSPAKGGLPQLAMSESGAEGRTS